MFAFPNQKLGNWWNWIPKVYQLAWESIKTFTGEVNFTYEILYVDKSI